MSSRHFTLLSLAIFLSLASPLITHADTKVLTAEATYTMGDGETPSFAETMALQKAKQMALEQAGTYVESYTKVQNYTLTADEIQTIAGGVLQIEILDKKRELIGDGLRHYVKINATVTTDKIADLAQRIKGKNVAEEYKKLQENYAKLSQEIEKWKQLVAKTPPGPEREAAFEQIRKRETAFTATQKKEEVFFHRLVSGQALLSKALGQLSTKQSQKTSVDALFLKILESGLLMTLGEPNIHTSLQNPDKVEISVPITLWMPNSIQTDIEQIALSLGGEVRNVYEQTVNARLELVTTQARAIRIGEDFETVDHFQRRIASLLFLLELTSDNGTSRYCYVAPQFSKPLDKNYLVRMPITPVPSILGDRFFDRGISYLKDSSRHGFVVVFDKPSKFLAKIVTPLEYAKRITNARGRILEGKLHNDLVESEIKGAKECNVE